VSTFIEASARPSDRHLAAVRNSFGWAQDSADRCDYADALGWIGMLEAIGELIPPDFEAKRQIWDSQMVAGSTDQGRS
jgi:hypothetical protein